MEIAHEWELERYGRFDSKVHNGWTIVDDQNHSLKILTSRNLVISSRSTVLVGLCVCYKFSVKAIIPANHVNEMRW